MTVSLGMHTVGNGADFGNDAQVTSRVTYATIHNGYNDATFVSIASFDLTTFIEYTANRFCILTVCFSLNYL